MSVGAEVEKPSVEEAEEVLIAEREERGRLCHEKIQALLKEDRCRIQIVTVIVDGKIKQEYRFIAL